MNEAKGNEERKEKVRTIQFQLSLYLKARLSHTGRQGYDRSHSFTVIGCTRNR